jgi:hypothetical protein
MSQDRVVVLETLCILKLLFERIVKGKYAELERRAIAK